jgi:hypothetical protein
VRTGIEHPFDNSAAYALSSACDNRGTGRKIDTIGHLRPQLFLLFQGTRH